MADSSLSLGLMRVELTCGHVQGVFALAGAPGQQRAKCGACCVTQDVVGPVEPTPHTTTTTTTQEA